MRVVLIEPPNLQRSGKWKAQSVYRTPTNLAILAAYIRKHGHEAAIFDFDVTEGSIEEYASLIMDKKPDVIGFVCLTPRYPAIVAIAKRCKEISPEVVVVLGGAHVSGAPESIFCDPAVDYGIVSEGEEALLELITRLDAGKEVNDVKNLALRQGAGIRVNPIRPFINNLDELPFPAWDLLEMKKYIDPALFRSYHAGVMTGRGCPYGCIYCASKVTWGRQARLHSVEYVVNQLEELVDTFGTTEFQFYDDTFTINRKRAMEICSLIMEKDLTIRYYVQARADSMNYDLARMLKESGCIGVAMGVESGDEEMLKRIDKGETKEEIRSAVQELKKVGLPCVTSYIVGLPGDTHETIQKTIDFADELGTEQAKFMIATPYPGTELYDMAMEKGLISPSKPEDFCDFTYYQHVAANLSHVSDEDLKKYQQEAYDKYDLKRKTLS